MYESIPVSEDSSVFEVVVVSFLREIGHKRVKYSVVIRTTFCTVFRNLSRLIYVNKKIKKYQNFSHPACYHSRPRR